jgi:hypothetical protein
VPRGVLFRQDVPVQIVEVDERTSSWEDPAPRFRVYFHRLDAEGEAEWTGTYDVTGCDVLQVIDWAQREAAAGELPWALALVGEQDDGRLGLTWLVGLDGVDTSVSGIEQDRHRRMWARRTGRIGVPALDRAPHDARSLEL